MFSKARLLVVAAAVGLAWLLGYGMGGGFQETGTGAMKPTPVSSAKPAGTGAGGASQNGIARPATDTLADVIAGRRVAWSRERLLAAAEGIGREPDIVHAVRLIMKLTERFEPEDFPLALEIAEEMEEHFGEEKEIYPAFAIMRWAELNPRAAAEFLRARDELKSGLVASQREVMLAVWSVSDPTGAIAWARTLEDPELREKALKDLLAGVARRSPEEAISLAKAQAPELLTGGQLANIVNDALRKKDPEQNARAMASLGGADYIQKATREWAGKNLQAAMEWAEGLSDEKLRVPAIQGAWAEFAASSPDDAAARLAARSANEPLLEDAARIVAAKLSERDRADAIRWAASLPQEAERRQAYAEVGGSFGRKDPSGGAKWLESLPPGQERDRATQAFANAVRENDPAAAAEWSSSITNSKARVETLRTVVTGWFGRDPGAALEWLNNTTRLSAEDRAAVLKKR